MEKLDYKEILADMWKIEDVIISCNTKEQLDAANNMVRLFYIKYAEYMSSNTQLKEFYGILEGFYGCKSRMIIIQNNEKDKK